MSWRARDARAEAREIRRWLEVPYEEMTVLLYDDGIHQVESRVLDTDGGWSRISTTPAYPEIAGYIRSKGARVTRAGEPS